MDIRILTRYQNVACVQFFQNNNKNKIYYLITDSEYAMYRKNNTRNISTEVIKLIN